MTNGRSIIIILLIWLLPVISWAQKPAEPKAKQLKDTISPAKKTVMDKAKQAAYQRISGYRNRVILGENMATLARRYSEDPGSKQDGGLYRNVTRGMMVAEFEAVAFSLKPGEISKVFETTEGFHFIQLLARRGEVIDMRHILITAK